MEKHALASKWSMGGWEQFCFVNKVVQKAERERETKIKRERAGERGGRESALDDLNFELP